MRLALSERVQVLALEAHVTAVVGPSAMTATQSPVLEFPSMLHGLTRAVLRKVKAKGQG